MTGGLVVSCVRFTAARAEQQQRGLLGWAQVVVSGFAIEVSIRRAVKGHLYVAYPFRVDRTGARHYLFRPVDESSRAGLEKQVLAAVRPIVGVH